MWWRLITCIHPFSNLCKLVGSHYESRVYSSCTSLLLQRWKAHDQVMRCFLLTQRLLASRNRIEVKRKQPVECSMEGSTLIENVVLVSFAGENLTWNYEEPYFYLLFCGLSCAENSTRPNLVSSLVHELVCLASSVSSSAGDTAKYVKCEIAKCLGEIGAFDLSTVALGDKRNRQGMTAWVLYGACLTHLLVCWSVPIN